MPGNSLGQLFRITSFGESHGGEIGVVIDGCPPGLEISEEEIQSELDRRRPGQSDIVTPRDEKDRVEIVSGVFEGKTTGTPIMLRAVNKEPRPQDYQNIKDQYRPSHADYVYDEKYGFRDYRGGGRSSARATWAVVAAGALAAKYLRTVWKDFEVLSYVQQVGDLQCEECELSRDLIEKSVVRCPDQAMAEKMVELIKSVKAQGDTVGGVIRSVVRGVPLGLGEPVFDKLSADLGKAMLSINAVKGFEFGSGFAGVEMRGSEHNDAFYMEGDRVRTRTNNSGGIQGGISNGEEIYFRVAFKPVATLMMDQDSVNREHEEVKMRAYGRHDACVLPRAVPIVDAMASLVLIDHYLKNKAQCQ